MKYITVIPVSEERATIIFAYEDLVITCVEGEVNSAGNIYGIPTADMPSIDIDLATTEELKFGQTTVDNQAARGGYEGYITDRLQVLGVDNDDLVAVMNAVNRAVKSGKTERIEL